MYIHDALLQESKYSLEKWMLQKEMYSNEYPQTTGAQIPGSARQGDWILCGGA
jgi:hypothetical protein